MLNLQVSSGDVLIGTSELFAADPPMGVAGIDCAGGLYQAWFGRDPAYPAYYRQ